MKIWVEKFLKGFVFAFRGLVYVFKSQRNMLVHLIFAIAVAASGVFLHISAVEFAILFLTISVVMCAEFINTAIENAVDHGSLEWGKFGGQAKDAAAGAVLLSGIFSVVIGLFILGPHLWALIIK